jgi:hypothetical protein
MHVQNKEYNVSLSKIGVGTYGSIYLLRVEGQNKIPPFAVKEQEAYEQDYISEIKAMKKALIGINNKRPHLPQLMGNVVSPNKKIGIMATPLAISDARNLFKTENKFSIPLFASILLQCVMSIRVMHLVFGKNHCDAHLGNMLVYHSPGSGYWEYKAHGNEWKIKNLGYYVVSYDYGLIDRPSCGIKRYKKGKNPGAAYDYLRVLSNHAGFLEMDSFPPSLKSDVCSALYLMYRMSGGTESREEFNYINDTKADFEIKFNHSKANMDDTHVFLELMNALDSISLISKPKLKTNRIEVYDMEK